MHIKWIAFLFINIPSAHALFIEANGFYFSDALVQSSNSTTGRTFFDGAIGFNIDKKGYYQAGWAYDSYATTDATGTTTTTFAATAMGPKFSFFLGKARGIFLGLTYGISTNATYTPNGGSAEKWQGTSYKIETGYLFRDEDSFFYGLRVNYVSANFTQKVVGTATYSTVSYSRTFIYPSITFGFDF